MNHTDDGYGNSVASRSGSSKTDLIAALERLSHEPGFVFAFAFLVRQNLFMNPEEVQDTDWRKRLSYQELTFLGGLMVKRPLALSVEPRAEKTAEFMGRADELFTQLHRAHVSPVMDKLADLLKKGGEGVPETEFKKLLAGEFTSEPIFYGESGAYDFQYWELARKKYAHDADWLKRNRRIEIDGLARISQTLKKLSEKKNREVPADLDFPDLGRSILDIFCFTRGDFQDIDADLVEGFLDASCLEPGTVNAGFDSPGGFNTLEARPVIRLDEGRFFLPISFELARSIYDSPFYWMLDDEGYRSHALENRGRYAEEITEEFLLRVFGLGNVFRNVKVFRKKRELLTDIDVLAICGNRAIIVQAKAKRLTELARKGDETRLRADFAAAVQNAYDQGLSARRAILDHHNRLETSDGRELKLHEFIRDAYLVCLTADHYPAIAHQVNVYLTREADDPVPLAISVFDLDVLTTYLTDPYKFLYYLRQRVTLSDHFRATSELVYLGYHLGHKLYPHESADHVGLEESFAAPFDVDFPVRRGYLAPPKRDPGLQNKWWNEEFETLLDQIKATGQPGFTDAVFVLYDMSSESADTMMKAIQKVNRTSRGDSKLHSFAFNDAQSGVSYVCMPGDAATLQRHTLGFAMAKKYVTRTESWLGLGGRLEGANLVDTFVFSSGAWEENDRLERFADEILKPGTLMKPDLKRIGRNQHCPCGSGKKFKRCHGR